MRKSWIALSLMLVVVVIALLVFWAITRRSPYVSAVELRFLVHQRGIHPRILQATEQSIFQEFWTVREDRTRVRNREFFTHQAGKSEFTVFDPQGTVLEHLVYPYDQKKVESKWEEIHRTYYLGRKWPSAQQVEKELQRKGYQPSQCCGRKAYLERRSPMVRIWHDARTGVVLLDQSYWSEEKRWVDYRRLKYAKWVLQDGDREVVYEIRCEQPPKQAGEK